MSITLVYNKNIIIIIAIHICIRVYLYMSKRVCILVYVYVLNTTPWYVFIIINIVSFIIENTQ